MKRSCKTGILLLALMSMLFIGTKEVRAQEFIMEQAANPVMVVTNALSNGTPVYAVSGGTTPVWLLSALNESGVSSSKSNYENTMKIDAYIRKRLNPGGVTVGTEAAWKLSTGSSADYALLFQEMAKATGITSFLAMGVSPVNGTSWNVIADNGSIFGVDTYYGDMNGTDSSIYPLNEMTGHVLSGMMDYAVKYAKQVVEAAAGNVILIGDSRMKGAVSQSGTLPGEAVMAEVGKGLSWYKNTVKPQLLKSLTSNSVVVTNLGINDVHNVNGYIAEYTKLLQSYPTIRLYVTSVNPVGTGYGQSGMSYTQMTSAIKKFNGALQSFAAMYPNVTYIDTYQYVQGNLSTSDNLHYSNSLNRQILNLWRQAVYQPAM